MTTTSTDSNDFAALEERHGIGVYKHRGVNLVRGRGSRVFDDQGRAYLDCTAAYGVTPLGHCHPVLVDAISKQASILMNCQGTFPNDQRALLFKELVDVLPKGMDRIFICNSGTEAIEAALKIARLTTGRRGVIACRRGFHGRTMGALSTTWEPHYREPFEPLVQGVKHVPYDDFAALEAAVDETVGAIVFEVVQGEGGVRPGSKEYFAAMTRLARERGFLLIVDEVQTGYCRTGRMFAVEHFDLAPDILCLAKGMAGGFPIGGVVLGSHVGKLELGVHGTTFGGNPLACAAARAVLKFMREQNLADHVAASGAWFMEHLRRKLISPRVREVRGLGLMIGIELEDKAQPFLPILQEKGLLTLIAGPTVIRLLPSLLITRDEMEEASTILAEVLNRGI